MQVLVRPKARKYFERLNEPNKGRIYTIETDLTAEEIAMIDEGMEEYRKDPSSFVPLDNIQ
jgi:hypothetical protein